MSTLPAIRESLLHRFVDESIDYERTGAPIPRSLLLYAAGGAAALLVAAISIHEIWPSPTSIRHDGFYLVGAETLAGFVGLLKALAVPLAITGLLALATTAYLAWRPRQRLFWHYACVGELIVGVGSLGASALVLVVIVLTVILWIIIGCLILAAVGIVLSMLGS